MKKTSTISSMEICAAIVMVGVLVGCGGGGGGAEAVLPMSDAGADLAALTSDTSGSTTSVVALFPGDAPVVAAQSADAAQAEATADEVDAKALLVSLSSKAPVTESGDAAVPGTSSGGSDSVTPGAAVTATGVTGAADALTAQIDSVTDDPAAAVRTLSATAGGARYAKLTDEHHIFTVPSNTLVRYGDPTKNKWVTKTLSGYGECTNEFFHTDPALGSVKICQVWLANASVAATSSTPVMSKPAGRMPAIDLTKVPLTPWVAYNDLRVQATTEQAPATDVGAFRTICSVARISFDDPIIFPGQSGKSHLHTFFGNTGVSADSTPESLRTTGGSTCRGGIANRSAYWVPTMIDTRDGTPVVSGGNGVYYKTGYDLPAAVVKPIPAGLRMIAGTPAATTPGGAGYRFKCAGGPNNENDKYGPTIPNCDVGATMIQEITFPQCWDGVNLDSPDHKSHMAYPSARSCPKSHPVAIPVISFNVGYTVTEKDQPLHWRLSSDNYDTSKPGGYSSHGDWFNGWKSDISDAWAKDCLHAVKDCHSHLLGDGRMLY